MVVGGNPARKICTYEEYLEKFKNDKMIEYDIYNYKNNKRM